MASNSLFSLSNEKFVKGEKYVENPPVKKLFCVHHFLRGRTQFEKDDVPLAFKATPDKLLELALSVVDEIPLPSVYTWTIEDICRWLRQLGYPQYQNTFKVNLINGRTLLLLDASALSAMNIKDFDHIRHLTHNIRSLFRFEMTKFGRSISLPREYYFELYKLFRVRNGPKYELTRPSDLWRQLKLIREQVPNMSHWELLERFFRKPRDEVELVGGAPRSKLNRCDLNLHPPHKPAHPHVLGTCLAPCSCHWTEEQLRVPSPLSCLVQRAKEREGSCRSQFYSMPSRATIGHLQKSRPHRYGPPDDIRLSSANTAGALNLPSH